MAAARIVSRFQFARPAVVSSLLDHSIFTPPVVAARVPIWLFVIFESNSARKAEARACLLSSNNFFVSLAALDSCFVGLAILLGEVSRWEKLESGGWSFGFVKSSFRGEYSSFQSLITSACQKLSILGRCGVFGIVICEVFLLGETRPKGPRSLEGLPGGVVSRVSLGSLKGLRVVGGELGVC